MEKKVPGRKGMSCVLKETNTQKRKRERKKGKEVGKAKRRCGEARKRNRTILKSYAVQSSALITSGVLALGDHSFSDTLETYPSVYIINHIVRLREMLAKKKKTESINVNYEFFLYKNGRIAYQ